MYNLNTSTLYYGKFSHHYIIHIIQIIQIIKIQNTSSLLQYRGKERSISK